MASDPAAGLSWYGSLTRATHKRQAQCGLAGSGREFSQLADSSNSDVEPVQVAYVRADGYCSMLSQLPAGRASRPLLALLTVEGGWFARVARHLFGLASVSMAVDYASTLCW